MHDEPFQPVNRRDAVRQGFLTQTYAFLALVYALVVRDLRSEHKNAALGILLSVAQPLVMGLVFYGFMEVVSGGRGQVRADRLTFVIIGFTLFFVHIRAASSVAGALRADMMNHQRLSPFLLICVRAVGSLYKNMLALLIMIALNYLLRGVYEMQDALLFVSVVFWCWLGGAAAGAVFLALNRYLSWGSVLQTTYIRIMFFTSGKFFVANKIGGELRPFFDWNPLFHLLDQGRSATFLNYTARTTSMDYAIGVSLAVLVVGFLVEHYVRSNYNASHLPGA